MGACTSADAQESLETPQHKKPHSKKHKNGLAIHIEYSPARTQEELDDKLSCVDTEELHPPGERDKIDLGPKGDGAEVLAGAQGLPVSLPSSTVTQIAPSDSGIDSLSTSETEHSEKHIPGSIDHTVHVREKNVTRSDNATLGGNTTSCDESTCTSRKCSCDKNGPWKLRRNAHEVGQEPSSSSSLSCKIPQQVPPMEATSIACPGSVHLDIPSSKRSSRDLRHFDSEPSLGLSSVCSSLQDVKTIQVDGKEVVLMDIETYSQILEELATLKLALSQLTDVIQLQDEDNSLETEMPTEVKTQLYFNDPDTNTEK